MEFLHLKPSCVGDRCPTLSPSPRVSGERVPGGRVRGLLGGCGRALVQSVKARRGPHPALRATFSRKREKEAGDECPRLIAGYPTAIA
jgi:hypothetical protein